MRFTKNKARFKGLLGILVIILAVSGLYAWETIGRQELTYTDVIVFKKDVEGQVVVSKEMLGRMKIESRILPSNTITDAELIIGKETSNYIPAQLPLTEKFFTSPELTPGKDQFIFKLPEEWVYSFPQSLRRGDEIFIYLVRNAKAVEAALNNGEAPVISEYGDAPQKPILSATVVYVKDNANREVVSTGEDRFDGTSSLAQIEIIASEADYNKLANAYNDGYCFNLMYR